MKQLLNDVNKVIGSNSKRIITMSTINNATDVQNLAVNLYPTMQERINIELDYEENTQIEQLEIEVLDHS